MVNEEYCKGIGTGNRDILPYSLCCVTYRTKVNGVGDNNHMSGTLLNGRKICVRLGDIKKNCYIYAYSKRGRYGMEKHIGDLLYKIQMENESYRWAYGI